jgi:putative hydrolase of the HAD superfamily
MPGVADTLSALGDRHDLLLLTKGQTAEQQRKIDASGLAPLFRSTHIVAEKEPGTYRALVDGERLDATSTWMIGNSPRSDVVAAREAGLRAVFIPHAHTWTLEHTDIDPDDDGVLHLRAFPDLLDHF